MNIFLVPHTWARHVAVGFTTALAAVLGWWTVINVIVVLGPTLYNMNLWIQQGLEGPLFLGAVAGAIGFANVYAEFSLRRRAVHWRVAFALVSGLLSAALAAIGAFVLSLLVPLIIGVFNAPLGQLMGDPSTVSLKYKLLEWLWAGLATGLGPMIARIIWLILKNFGLDALSSKEGAKGLATLDNVGTLWQQRPSFFNHVVGATAAAALGAGVWQALGTLVFRDLYLASAIGSFTWGFFHGLLVWGVPSELYAGWVRILSSHRYGLRIPIDRLEGGPSERFLGHYPRGLDVMLPAEHGVAELHASFLVDETGSYSVRGLSQQPTMVKRFLESVDLSYDPASPSPLETGLKMEDRVTLGDKSSGRTELEFILLPKEER